MLLGGIAGWLHLVAAVLTAGVAFHNAWRWRRSARYASLIGGVGWLVALAYGYMMFGSR